MDYGSVALLYDYHATQTSREDVAFYLEEAQAAGGPVLELGCGTGRILAPLARAGVDITGLDSSDGMLARCREAVGDLPVLLVLGDMRDFQLERRFRLITIPFRAFQHLLTVQDQLACLACVRRHLEPGGRLILDLYNPWLEYLVEDRGDLRQDGPSSTLPDGSEMTRYVRRLSLDLFTQVQEIEMRYHVQAPDGAEAWHTHRFSIRNIYRYEAEHLLVRAGFKVEALYADLDRAEYGTVRPGELIFVASVPPTDSGGA